MRELNKMQLLDLGKRATYDFLDAEMIRLLSDVKSEDKLRTIQQRGLEAYETLSGRRIDVGSLELTRATVGLGLMLSLADIEAAVINERLEEIRAVIRAGG